MSGRYYARSPNQAGEWETVPHHLQRAAALCSEFLSCIGYEDWGRAAALLHDFGKYSDMFADVLRRKRTHVNHAVPGAALAYNFYAKRWPAAASLIASVIAAHHSHLEFCSVHMLKRILRGEGDRLDSEGYTLSLFGQQEFQQAASIWNQAIQPPMLTASVPDFSRFEDASLARMLFARLLFSALVDADYCSSAEHFEPDYLARTTGPVFDPADALTRLKALQSDKRRHSTAAASLNRLRDQLFADCEAAAAEPPGLFTLTAPTGLGKTLSLFAFAANHCRIHGKRRVILILPFLSIIDQNVRDYRQIVPDLVEIHSNAIPDERARLLSQRWSAPCIVTTNVGFFEPLFSAQPMACHHLHQLADSVIVLDEAQSLPPHLLDATLRTVKLLCDQYRCSVVFSTATQPAFDFRPGLSWKPREIARDPDALFAATRRVTYDWRIDRPISMEQLADEAAAETQVCVIVNLRRHARELYALLEERCGAEETFFLTSDLCPAHRLAVLQQVKERLSAGQPCRLVATQCVEAGVDFDAPVVYRALAPLESIIQAAGRCNRNGDQPTGRVVVFVPESDLLYPPGGFYEHGANCVRTLLSRHPIDCSNPAHIQEYYRLVFAHADGDAGELRAAIENEDFAATEKAYRMIEQRGVQVIVPYAAERALFTRIRDALDAHGVTAELLRQARPLTVSTFDIQAVERHCEQLCYHSPEDGGSRVPTGFYLLGDPAFYSDKQGLIWEEQNFTGIF